ncbi:MAG: hypothetical protein K1X53_17595, partial [Candidatus Sumerlaeaceae bacterium]|nr:hypothetical protein [Candidatus Sumerlaeaceae bacterium]
AGLMAIFFGLSFYCEVFYFNDIFSGAIERINTVFKVYYGLWPLLVLATVLALKRLLRYRRPAAARARLARVSVAAMVLLGGVYPIAAPLQRIEMTSRPEPTSNAHDALNGLRHLRRTKPGDYAAILWVRSHLSTRDHLLEAVGTQYTYAGRISTNTGIPALGGWLYHSWGWRGDTFLPERDRRIRTGQLLYETTDPAVAWTLLTRNKLNYVVVGQAERDVYPGLDEKKFAEMGEVAFSNAGTTIYRIRDGLQIALVSDRQIARLLADLPVVRSDAGDAAPPEDSLAPSTDFQPMGLVGISESPDNDTTAPETADPKSQATTESETTGSLTGRSVVIPDDTTSKITVRQKITG